MPKTWLSEKYEKFLYVIQMYFTCEGRFNIVYQYNFRLLLHFTSKQPLDIPFYLYRTLGKMEDKAHSKTQVTKRYFFHFGLIKRLVLEELRKMNRDWNTFLFLANYGLKLIRTPYKRISLVMLEQQTHGGEDTIFEQGKEDEGPDIEIIEVIGSKNTGRRMKGMKLEFTQETNEMVKPRRPVTRSTTHKLDPVREDIPQLYVETPKHQEVDKDDQ